LAFVFEVDRLEIH